MSLSTDLFLLLPCAVSAAISAGVAAYCWRRRGRPGVAAFTIVAGCEALWTLGYLFQMASPGLRQKVFWDNLQYLPMAVIAPAFLAFAHGFCGRQPRHPRRVYGALALPLLAVAALAFTDPLHGMVCAGTESGGQPGARAGQGRGGGGVERARRSAVRDTGEAPPSK